MSSPARRGGTEDREREILRLLREHPDGLSVKQIYAEVTETLSDPVTLPAYYKVLHRMTAAAQLDVQADGAGERTYVIAAHLHPETALTLDDVYALMDELEPTDAIARVIDAREYFEEHRHDVLKRAAAALLDEDPRELMFRFLVELADQLDADAVMLAEEQLRDAPLEARVRGQLRELHQLAYRLLGLSQAAISVPWELMSPRGAGPAPRVVYDPEVLRREIARRVYGSRAIESIDTNDPADREQWSRNVVAGTDGSTYSNVLQIASASRFTDDAGGETVTFNNSVAFVLTREGQRIAEPDQPYYSVPMSRSAIDEPMNRGMVLAPFMHRYLPESEYEHMAKCATDVVQWRADEAVFSGTARSLGTGTTLPAPRVLFRDGTITPQEREYGHYRRHNAYGDMVREGVLRSRNILRVITSARNPPVFAGAVKTTQARLFSSLLNWYVARGSAATLGQPIDSTWDTTRAAHIADNESMSMLLSTLEDRRRPGEYFVTFQVLRPFHTLTEYYRHSQRDDPEEWVEWFTKKQAREQADYDSGASPDPPYLTTVPSVEDEPFVWMCTEADYVSFYIGHTTGDPPPLVPRYEFLEALRGMTAEQAEARVGRNVSLVVGALERSKFSLDRDHNFLSRKSLVKIVPFVVYEAHEKCKAIGRQLNTELRSIVIQNLQGLRNAKDVSPKQVRFLPESVRRHVERTQRALRDDPNDTDVR